MAGSHGVLIGVRKEEGPLHLLEKIAAREQTRAMIA
jgi:hypothetical protein